MKNVFILFLLLFLCNCKNNMDIKNKLNYSDKSLFNKQITEILYNAIRDYPDQSEFAIGLVLGDTTEYYGLKKNNSDVINISNTNSIFEIGSISKVFLTSLLVQAINDTLLKLSSKLSDVIPFEIACYGYEDQEVEVLHLANHTSGIEPLPHGLIKDYQFDEKDDDEVAVVKGYLKENAKFKWQSGRKYEYSNLGMALLGQIISEKYNKSYESLVKKYITEMIGMDNTSVKLSSDQKKRLVPGLDPYGRKSAMLVSELYSCSGGLKSNVIDMVKFIKANMKNDYKYKLAHETTFEIDETYSVGLGWSYSNRNNSRVYFHHGGTIGYSSGIAFDKVNKIGIVVLTNRSALLKSVPDINGFMYKIFGEIFYKFRVQGI